MRRPGLFDFKFEHFLATKIVAVVYGLSIVLWIIAGVVSLILGVIEEWPRLQDGEFRFEQLARLLGTPIGVVVSIVLTRVWCEFVVIGFRIYDELRNLRMALTKGGH